VRVVVERVWVRVCEMKLLSWNVWGLGGPEKRKEVCFIVKEKRSLIMCLQETKLQGCDARMCSALWDGQQAAFSFRQFLGASVGLLTIWDMSEVEVWSTSSFDHVLSIHGHFIQSNEEFHLFNVYAPFDVHARQVLLEILSVRIQALRGKKICVCGDFNVVRCREERKSVSVSVVADYGPFNHFVDENGLIDIPLWWCKFTWFKGMASR